MVKAVGMLWEAKVVTLQALCRDSCGGIEEDHDKSQSEYEVPGRNHQTLHKQECYLTLTFGESKQMLSVQITLRDFILFY